MKYPSKIEDWEKFESNNSTIVLDVLYEKEKKPNNSLNDPKRSALFKGITSKHDGNFYCLNCLHSLIRLK